MAYKIELPRKVQEIISRLEESGYEAYAVGGCVRDVLLSRNPPDWDITTSARPEEIKRLFSRTVDTGIEHGTVTVLIGKESFEVTTYREDGTYLDGRHPVSVTFLPCLEEDLKRRDFTVNAMAYNERSGLVDLFDGISDLKAGIIRCVGRPEDRFGEDALRMMRALRFSAQLGFRIDDAALSAIEAMHGSIGRVSAERTSTEFVKILLSAHPELWKTACDTGICDVIIPEFARLMKLFPGGQEDMHVSLGIHALDTTALLERHRYKRLAAFFRNIAWKPGFREGVEDTDGERLAVKILRRMKFDNETIRTVSRLVRFHACGPYSDEVSVRRAVCMMGRDLFPLWESVEEADCQAYGDSLSIMRFDAFQETACIYRRIMERGDCVSYDTLALTGHDLVDAGLREGPEVGAVLRRLLEYVLEDPSRNTAETLRSYANAQIKNLHKQA